MKDMDMEKCFFGEGAIKQRGRITGGLLGSVEREAHRK